MAIRVKEINGKNYMYFIHYPNGKKVDVYCGVESNPESRKKALTMEIEATKRQISKLNRKLEGLTSQFEKVCEESAITPPPAKLATTNEID